MISYLIGINKHVQKIIYCGFQYIFLKNMCVRKHKYIYRGRGRETYYFGSFTRLPLYLQVQLKSIKLQKMLKKLEIQEKFVCYKNIHDYILFLNKFQFLKKMYVLF